MHTCSTIIVMAWDRNQQRGADTHMRDGVQTHTATPLHNIKKALWIPHCRSFSWVRHTLIDPFTGQRSQDSPIRPHRTKGPPPLLPKIPAFRSFIHPPLWTPFCSAVISHFVSSKWLLTVLAEVLFFCQSPSQMWLPIISSLHIHHPV